jgi:peptidyl-prolyl cis-trans isomerase D
MTMLDRMRRHKGWLKWSLGIVVVAFIVLYIPSFLTPQGGPAARDVIATVNGRDITVGEFRQAYYQQIQAYRQAYGGNLTDELLKQMGIDQRLLQQMIDEQAALVEAQRLGISASDAELRERIMTMPAFTDNGRFIGEAQYRQILQMQNPPLTTAEFEQQLRRSLIVTKLHGAITDWMTVSDHDVDAEYRRRHEQVKIELVSFPADKFRAGIKPTDQEITAYFDAHKENYRIPEKRRIEHLLIDVQAMRQKATVSASEIERYYNDNQDQFSTPAQVRASHILFKTEGKDEAAVRKEAEAVLKQAKAGADFAALAKKYSQDDASKANGGDLGFFSEGQMVPEFEKAAFSMEPGQISGLIKTQYGFHIIKVTDKKPAVTKPLAEVRKQIEDQLKFEQAQTQASKLSDTVSSEIKTPGDFAKVAKAHGLTVGESGYFDEQEPITGIGFAPEVNSVAFQMTEGQVSPPIRTSQGFVIITVTGTQAAYIPKLDEVKSKVTEDVIVQKAVAAARAKAAELSATAAKGGNLAKAAKADGLEVKTSELAARGTAWPEVGANPKIDDVAFSLKPGEVSQPVDTATAAVVIKVLDRKDVTPAEIAAGREALRQEMLSDRRNRFFTAYMTKAKAKMKIEINRSALQQATA